VGSANPSPIAVTSLALQPLSIFRGESRYVRHNVEPGARKLANCDQLYATMSLTYKPAEEREHAFKLRMPPLEQGQTVCKITVISSTVKAITFFKYAKLRFARQGQVTDGPLTPLTIAIDPDTSTLKMNQVFLLPVTLFKADRADHFQPKLLKIELLGFCEGQSSAESLGVMHANISEYLSTTQLNSDVVTIGLKKDCVDAVPWEARVRFELLTTAADIKKAEPGALIPGKPLDVRTQLRDESLLRSMGQSTPKHQIAMTVIQSIKRAAEDNKTLCRTLMLRWKERTDAWDGRKEMSPRRRVRPSFINFKVMNPGGPPKCL